MDTQPTPPDAANTSGGGQTKAQLQAVTPAPPVPADPREISLTRNEKGQLVLRAKPEAEPLVGVRVARCFPWSFRSGYFSVRDADGHELCLARTLDEFHPDARKLIEEELKLQEFVPHITAIEAVVDRFDVMIWKVQTDRGPIELEVQHTEDVRQLEDGRVLIKDHAGGLFEVPDPAALDHQSRKLLENHLA